MMGSGDSTFHWARDIGMFLGGILSMALAVILSVDYYLWLRFSRRRRQGSAQTTSRTHRPG